MKRKLSDFFASRKQSTDEITPTPQETSEKEDGSSPAPDRETPNEKQKTSQENEIPTKVETEEKGEEDAIEPPAKRIKEELYPHCSDFIEDQETEFCMGIDEAGRGPVLGPMVYSAAWCPVTAKDKIATMGFMDSKKLKPQTRELLFKTIRGQKGIKEQLGFKVIVIGPEELSYKMLSIQKINLNAISHSAAIQLIQQALTKGIKLTEVFLDTVGDPKKYRRLLKRKFPTLSITVCPKADVIYPIVSAASICAKVIRDQTLKSWQFKEGNITSSREFGSGYPSDPTTKRWLKQNIDKIFGFPSVIRFSWKPCIRVLDKNAVAVKWTKYDETDTYDVLQSRIKFSNRYRYFSDTCLEIVKDF